MHGQHPVKRAALAQQEMEKRKIQGISFPLRAADINPIESLCRRVAGLVCTGNRVYSDQSSLVHAVNEAWAAVQSNVQLRENEFRSSLVA